MCCGASDGDSHEGVGCETSFYADYIDVREGGEKCVGTRCGKSRRADQREQPGISVKAKEPGTSDGEVPGPKHQKTLMNMHYEGAPKKSRREA